MEEFEIIEKLMEELKEKMQYGEEDFAERLGKKKPEVEVTKIEGEMPLEGEELMSGEMEIAESPEDKLKNRLLKLRG